MSLFVLISGFGPPHYEHKLQILENNLEKICSYKWTRLTIKICQYVSPRHFQIPQSLQEKYNLEVIYETGVVGEFIKRHANPVRLAPYDYVLILLDDVELLSIDFEKMIKYQQDLHLDILSPTMTPDSKYQYPYMLQDTNTTPHLKLTAVCEYFCMFFPLSAFTLYYQHITLDNPWMWGLDLVLHKHVGLKVALCNEFTMKHWYKSESYGMRPDMDPAAGFHRCIARYGETPTQLSEQKAIRYLVFIPS